MSILFMLSYLSTGGQHDGAWRRAGARNITHGVATPDCVVKYIHQLCAGLTQSGQGHENYQHDFLAVLPPWRRPESVLAAI
jgi:hypothetical protein